MPISQSPVCKQCGGRIELSAGWVDDVHTGELMLAEIYECLTCGASAGMLHDVDQDDIPPLCRTAVSQSFS